MADDIELAPTEGGSKMKIVIAVLVGVIVAVGGTLGGLFAMGILPPKEPQVEAEAPVEEVLPAPAVYVALDPPFTVNFSDEGDVRYLQVQLQAMTRDPDVEYEIKRHMPLIRSELMLLFSAQKAKALGNREGKDALRAEALASIQGILERETGVEESVEELYFTAFVMQ